MNHLSGNKRPQESEATTNIEEEDLATEYANVVQALENIETKLRIEHIPSLVQRAPPVEFDDIHDVVDGTEDGIHDDNVKDSTNKQAILTQDEKDGSMICSMKKFGLRTFSLSLIAPPLPEESSTSFMTKITTLDLSYNEIMDIPGLSEMINLHTLNLERGWFNTLPLEIGSLKYLHTINASRNFLRPNAKSLQLDQLKLLPHLKTLDLTYNQKCGTTAHHKFISSELPQIQNIKVTLWEEVGKVTGSYVGKCASERDSRLLRSQLEPWGTVQLRKRLVQDFNQLPTHAAIVDRAGVMKSLLHCYAKEGLMDEQTGLEKRQRIHVDGAPVNQTLIDDLLLELRKWTKETGLDNKNRERPSIDARNYMILRRPKSDLGKEPNNNHDCNDGNKKASRRAIRKAKKMSKYNTIWELGIKALKTVNPRFADQCTEIAVTFGFQGSPHIDKQNSGPFFGLALGNFKSGQGGVCVECSARLVAVVNTKHRLGRIDGRFPHWVDSYDRIDDHGNELERYSLIYYETGNNFRKPGPAIFSVPSDNGRSYSPTGYK